MEVELFTSELCDACEDIEEFLESKGIEYNRHDVLKDEGAIKKLKKKGEYDGEGPINVPVWCVGRSCFKGFSEEKIKEELIT